MLGGTGVYFTPSSVYYFVIGLKFGFFFVF